MVQAFENTRYHKTAVPCNPFHNPFIVYQLPIVLSLVSLCLDLVECFTDTLCIALLLSVDALIVTCQS